jgi:Tfp pilus assembly protein PilZ
MLNQPHTGFTRIPYTQMCRVVRHDVAVDGVLCNISVLGVYIALDEVPEVGETVELRFALPGGIRITSSGLVVWRNAEDSASAHRLPPGCGVRFVGLEPQYSRQIDELVNAYKAALPLGIGATPPRSGHVRVPYMQRCQLMVAGVPQLGIVCNVSTLGVYVATDPVLPVGTGADISFMLPRDPHRFESASTVMWRNSEERRSVDSLPPGVGLRFEALASENRARLERLVLEYEYCATVASASVSTGTSTSSR